MELDSSYQQLLAAIKSQVNQSQLTAIRSVNQQLIRLYWKIGELIHQKQEEHGWGKSVVEKLSSDLQKAFPRSKGFSARNLWEMRKFFHFYSGVPILQQLVAEIPWGHNLLIMNKLSDREEIKFYLTSTAKFGWSRNVLLNQIKADAYHRRTLDAQQHNFSQTLRRG